MASSGGRAHLPATRGENRRALRPAGSCGESLDAVVARETRLPRPLNLPAAFGEPEFSLHAGRLAAVGTATVDPTFFMDAGYHDFFVPVAADAAVMPGESAQAGDAR